jgi:hypothetical protein
MKAAYVLCACISLLDKCDCPCTSYIPQLQNKQFPSLVTASIGKLHVLKSRFHRIYVLWTTIIYFRKSLRPITTAVPSCLSSDTISNHTLRLYFRPSGSCSLGKEFSLLLDTNRLCRQTMFWILNQVPILTTGLFQWPRGLRVCGRSLVGIGGSNPAGGMDVCLLWVSCVVRQRFLRRADHSSRGVLPSVVCLYDCEPRWWERPGALGAVAPWGKKTFNVFQATTEPQIVRKTSRQQVECWRSFFVGVKMF